MKVDDGWDIRNGPYRAEEMPADVELVVSLRNHLAVVAGANQLMADQWSTLSEDERLQLLSLALRGVDQLAEDVHRYADNVADGSVVDLTAEATPLQW